MELLISISRFFWAQMSLAALVAIQGPKKDRFQGPPLIMALVMDIARLKIVTYRAMKTTGTLLVNMHDAKGNTKHILSLLC
jgi:hypothetical protein